MAVISVLLRDLKLFHDKKDFLASVSRSFTVLYMRGTDIWKQKSKNILLLSS